MALHHEETLLLDSGLDFRARHLTLSGTNYEIGRRIGELAAERYSIAKVPAGTPLQNRCRRLYLQRHYPIFWDRMRGFAEASGIPPEDDSYDLSVFGSSFSGLGCSVVYYPPAETTSGHGLLGKNLDFIAWGISPEITSPLSEPYVLEMHPDRGYASLGLMSFGLFGHRLEGINSQGLAVVHLADTESSGVAALQPAGDCGVGLSELQSVEILLDTCACASEAAEVLLGHKHYYRLLPVHLIIADRSGSCFVWEHSPVRNTEHIVEWAQSPRALTNFLLHRHLKIESLPRPSSEPGCPYNRFRALVAGDAEVRGKQTPGSIMRTLERATVGPDAFCEPQPIRTVWRELWDVYERSLTIRFFLGNPKEMAFSKDFTVRL